MASVNRGIEQKGQFTMRYGPIFAALVAAASLAAPALADPTPVRSAAVWNAITELEQDVNRADSRDTISEREAAGIRSRIGEIKEDYRRWNGNGLTVGEANTLTNRVQAQRNRLHNERNDRDHHRH
jgi:hypothetical protein